PWRRARPQRSRPAPCSLEQSVQNGPREVGLADEAARAARLDERAVRLALAARHEHDRLVAAALPQARRDLEAVDVGELDVEQDDVGRELGREGERGGAVLRLAHDLEALGGEER